MESFLFTPSKVKSNSKMLVLILFHIKKYQILVSDKYQNNDTVAKEAIIMWVGKQMKKRKTPKMATIYPAT